MALNLVVGTYLYGPKVNCNDSCSSRTIENRILFAVEELMAVLATGRRANRSFDKNGNS
jgi:hypothetical protein